MPKFVDEVEKAIINFIKLYKVETGAISVDVWTKKSTGSFVNIYVHFYRQDFVPLIFLLGFQPIRDKSASTLRDVVLRLFDKFNLHGEY